MDANILYAHQTQPPSLGSKPATSAIAGPHTAFFYGTLMAPSVLSRVCHGPALPGSTTRSFKLHTRPALLKSYRRHRVKQADYPAILPSDRSTVRGTLVTGLTDGDIWRLDIFEGDEYERRKVNVRMIEGDADGRFEPDEGQLSEEVEAETYVWIAGRDLLESREWDFEEFVKEKMARWDGSGGEESGEYDDVDHAVQAARGNEKRDPTGGRSLDGGLGRAVEASRGQERVI